MNRVHYKRGLDTHCGAIPGVHTESGSVASQQNEARNEYTPFYLAGNKSVRYTAYTRTSITFDGRAKQSELAHFRKNLWSELCADLRPKRFTTEYRIYFLFVGLLVLWEEASPSVHEPS